MFQIVYVSSAVSAFSSDELLDLMARSREKNAKAEVSGMLLYKDGNFMQVLEGPEEAVRGTHARIEGDPRHRGLLTLVRGSVEGRRFPSWSMGFRDLRSPEVISAPGYNAFLNTPLTGREFSGDPTRCERLLLTFKRSM